MKCDELLKKLEKAGWKQIRQQGSHKILRKDGEQQIIVFPYHRGKEVPTGTANRIMKQAGLK
jgi:predicted RNA binding protein YcfA (HicA-like mRNA interferase family)